MRGSQVDSFPLFSRRLRVGCVAGTRVTDGVLSADRDAIHARHAAAVIDLMRCGINAGGLAVAFALVATVALREVDDGPQQSESA